MHLLTEPASSSKTVKAKNAANYILHLWPNRWLCPNEDGCMKDCLKSAGRGQFDSVRRGRYRKTRLWHQHPEEFMRQLRKDLDLVRKRYLEGTGGRYDGLVPYVRLNGTSDLPWEVYDAFAPRDEVFNVTPIPALYPELRFYDYTKDWTRDPSPLSNYRLTFSRGATTSESKLKDVLSRGGRVAVVFRPGELPASYLGSPVINGDKDDLRWEDPPGVVVGLTAKGKARTNNNGFVVEV